MRPTLDAATFGAWLLKSRPNTAATDSWREAGFTGETTRCVRKSYRLDLVAAGQPVLLWISGQDADLPAGIHAQGRTTGGVRPGVANDPPVMGVELRPVDPVVLRRDVQLHPELSQLEVIRAPVGSNPSYVTRRQLDELRRVWPQVNPS